MSLIENQGYNAILDAFYRDGYREGFVKHHLDSYHFLISIGIPKIIENQNPISFLVEYKQSDDEKALGLGGNKKVKFFDHTLTFTGVRIDKPGIYEGMNKQKRILYPNECRMINRTYQADIYVDVTHKIKLLDSNMKEINTELKREYKKERVRIGAIPVMLHSQLCSLYGLSDIDLRTIAKEDPYDLGGYFIVNGSEKVLISQEKKISNHVTFYANPKKSYPYVVEIKCTKDDTYGAPSTATVMFDKKGRMLFALNPGFAPNVRIPIFVIFKALGIVDDKTIIQYMTYNENDETMLNLLKPSIYHKIKKTAKSDDNNDVIINTQRDALNFIAEEIRAKKGSLLRSRGINVEDIDKKVDFMMGIFAKHLFPHIKSNDNDPKIKAYFLGYMCNKLLLGRRGIISEDDRDNFGLKNIDTSGILMSQLFYQCYSIFLNKLKENIRRESTNKNFAPEEFEMMLNRVIPDVEIESKIKRAFSTGEWSVSKSSLNTSKQGVAQLMQRLTPLNAISSLRRIVSPSNANQKTKPEIRRVHPTHWNIVCCVETPEGQSIGLVKNMALLMKITLSSSPTIIFALLNEMEDVVRLNDITPAQIKHFTKIFINGEWIAITGSGIKIVDELRKKRRSGIIDRSISIVMDFTTNEIRIYSDAGRCMRPILIVDSGNKIRITSEIYKKIYDNKMQWDDLIENQFIEYIDVQEGQYNSLVAMYPEDLLKPENINKKFTHCEIHPYTMLGIAASLIPFLNSNQCIYQEELIEMSDRSYKKIKDIRIGDEVITFNPSTFEQSTTKIVDIYSGKIDKKMYKISTLSGRNIITTFDHKIMTNQGWKTPQEMLENPDIKIAISLNSDKKMHSNLPQIKKELLSEKIFVECAKTLKIPENIIIDCLLKYRKNNILPLENTHLLISKLARLYGFYLYFDKFIDNKNEIPELHLNKEKVNKIIFTDINYFGDNESLSILLMVLTEINSRWIDECSDLVKSEFLNGYCNGNTIINDEIEKEYITLHCNLMLYVRHFLEYFKIKVSEIQIKESKDNKVKILMEIDKSDDNLINFYDKIGLNYNENYIKNGKLVEYLKSGRNAGFADIENNDEFLYIPIHKIEEVTDEKYKNICDITTQSKNKSFVCNNICVHNSPRNLFQSAQCKAALSIYAMNYRDRMDTMGHVLRYPEKPLVATAMSKYLKYDQVPAGQNLVVAIMTYTGYNQEDSLIFNKASIERGLFRSTYFKMYKEELNSNEDFRTPDINETAKYKTHLNYTKLGDNGFPPINTKIVKDDIIIGKVKKLDNREQYSNFIYKDQSIPLKEREAYIDDIVKDKNQDGNRFAKVRIRMDRMPQIGNKAACYSEDTEILTTSGWIKFPELTKKHKVATLVGDRLEYQYPYALQKYEVDEDLYYVDSTQIDLLVTKNHRMYVAPHTKKKNKKYEIIEAEKLNGKKFHYKKNVDIFNPDLTDFPEELILSEDGRTIGYFTLGSYIFPIKYWCIFFGIWIAEGWCGKDYLQISAHKDRVKNELQKCFDEMDFQGYGIHVGKSNDGKGNQDGEKIGTDLNTWRIYDFHIRKYFRSLNITCAITKKLPEWVWFLERENTRDLIDGMICGDGHQMKGASTRRYDTSSTELADDFQRLCLHAGYSTNKLIKDEKGTQSINRQTGEIITMTTDAYRMSIITVQIEPLVNKNYSQMTRKKSDINKNKINKKDGFQHYKGNVYCCSVKNGDGIVYVRRNGYSVWSGQSRHGQKGICGMVYDDKDMPFTENGIKPDLLVNPHALPSRMTIAQIIECVLGKGCALKCTFADATPFNNVAVQDIVKELEKTGYDGYGYERLYSGFTSEPIKCKIFIGPTYYQILKHMVKDKMHARARGTRQMISHQPVEGRNVGGGHRFGEMERDCMISHGLAAFLKERFVECSDGFECYVDDESGLICIGNPETKHYLGKSTNNSTKITKICIPYSMKQFIYECMTCNLAMRLITEQISI